jgi:SAM-dependent methyltransferase
MPSHHVLEAAQGSVEIVQISDGRFKVTLKPNNPDTFIARSSCETSLPPGVISDFLSASFVWLCDSLARHDDPGYLRRTLLNQMRAYFHTSDFRGKRLLDFGCGSGASTLFIAAMFPDTEVVGVELDPHSIKLARRVLALRRLPNVRFLESPSARCLPPGIGTFDFVVLSAVYEHLLPVERRLLLPLIWSAMNPGGHLLISQTPYRWFPYEHHSTGLWGINYVPARFAHLLARRFSKRNPEINKSRDWTAHLRGGIRGATEMEIVHNLRQGKPRPPTIIQPRHHDRAAYWLSCTNSQRYRLFKKLIAALFRVTDRFWGTIPSIHVDVVLRKDHDGHSEGALAAA